MHDPALRDNSKTIWEGMIVIAVMLSPSISAGLSIQRGDDQGSPSQRGTLLEAGLEGAESSKMKRQ